MTLSFVQHIKKVPNYFPEKILLGIDKFIGSVHTEHYLLKILALRNRKSLEVIALNSKIHTIRKDELNRWKAGMKIHFVINNRRKNRLQFAPVLKCVSTQAVVIKYFYDEKTHGFTSPTVLIDGKEIKGKMLKQLAYNDGFNTLADFFDYFNEDFTGKLIHWTTWNY